jgi:hypothetical protein
MVLSASNLLQVVEVMNALGATLKPHFCPLSQLRSWVQTPKRVLCIQEHYVLL